MKTGILLDTHAWIWLTQGIELSSKVVSKIDAAATAGKLYLAAISVWELSMLEAKGRIEMQTHVEVWTEQALSIRGLSLLPLTAPIALAASRLPGNFHGDPADRLIVATARYHQLQLATRDQKILNWAQTEDLQTLSL